MSVYLCNSPDYMTVSDGGIRDMQVVVIPAPPSGGMHSIPQPPSIFQTAFYHMVRRDGRE